VWWQQFNGYQWKWRKWRRVWQRRQLGQRRSLGEWWGKRIF
jgi:hypothetical protein